MSDKKSVTSNGITPSWQSYPNTSSSAIDLLRDLATNLQIFAGTYGTKINKVGSILDKDYEPVIVGSQHRAAGILVYHVDKKEKKIHVLLANFAKKEGDIPEYQIPGGKAQGIEYPLETAIREFNEETLFIFKDEMSILKKSPQTCHNFVDGKYTLFLVDSSVCKLGSIDEVKDGFKLSMEICKMQNRLPKAKIPVSLDWIEYTVPSHKFCAKFANQMLVDTAISNFMLNLLK